MSVDVAIVEAVLVPVHMWGVGLFAVPVAVRLHLVRAKVFAAAW